MIKSWKKKIQEYVESIIRTKPTPHAIALGFSIGTGISILPTPGLNLLLAIGVLLIFKNVNKYSLFLSIFFWNILTLAPLYLLSYKIGNIVFDPTPVVTYEISLWDKVYFFSRRFLFGNVLIAVGMSVCSYFAVKFLAKMYYAKKP
jgi:uncharacterized protein